MVTGTVLGIASLIMSAVGGGFSIASGIRGNKNAREKYEQDLEEEKRVMQERRAASKKQFDIDTSMNRRASRLADMKYENELSETREDLAEKKREAMIGMRERNAQRVAGVDMLASDPFGTRKGGNDGIL